MKLTAPWALWGEALTASSTSMNGRRAYGGRSTFRFSLFSSKSYETSAEKQASSREDDKQLALLAEAAEAAEKGDHQGVACFFRGGSKSVLGTAKDIGTDLAAKVIAEMLRGLVA